VSTGIKLSNCKNVEVIDNKFYGLETAIDADNSESMYFDNNEIVVADKSITELRELVNKQTMLNSDTKAKIEQLINQLAAENITDRKKEILYKIMNSAANAAVVIGFVKTLL